MRLRFRRLAQPENAGKTLDHVYSKGFPLAREINIEVAENMLFLHVPV